MYLLKLYGIIIVVPEEYKKRKEGVAMFVILEWFKDSNGKKHFSVYRKRFPSFSLAYEYAIEKLYYRAEYNSEEGFHIVHIITK